MIQLLLGDCRDRLKELPDNSIDSIVTDPPYELGFMGKSWDASGVAYDVTVWQECLRVLKPGGHLLSFGGSRTYHRMACAIEDAGFQIRDQIMWVYGSGFPKSLNISKAIDKRGGENIGWFGQWLRNWRKENNIHQKDIAVLFPSKTGNLTGCVANWELGFNVPTAEQFSLICEKFNLPFKSISEAEREVVGSKVSGIGTAFGDGEWASGKAQEVDITAPATAEAEEWDGWGTALKPAHEPIVLARKPLDGTVANNVLKHGVGGINIDGCRVDGRESDQSRGAKETSNVYSKISVQSLDNAYPKELGRFPANFIHDGSDEVLQLFPDTKGGTWNTTKGARHFNNDGEPTGYETSKSDSSTGSAARFFYCAKASKKDRNEGLDGFADKEVHRYGAGIGEVLTPNAPANDKNHHPTVKPTDLMRYLCRLVTPPNGTVLDPFTGSGSTGKAATLEGFNFIGIEQSAEYIEIAKARIESVNK